MILKPLTEYNMEQVRLWRHQVPETLRTPYMLTEEMQQQYYRDVICNRNSTTRYWALWERIVTQGWSDGGAYKVKRSYDTFVGYGGIENISWANSIGEMSLLISPDHWWEGFGREAVGLFLEQAFMHMGLKYVYGECYECGPYGFWKKMLEAYGGRYTWLWARKYYDGRYWDSYYFTFSAADYRNSTRPRRKQADPAEEHPGLSRTTYPDLYTPSPEGLPAV